MFVNARKRHRLRRKVYEAKDALMTLQSQYKRGETSIESLSGAQKRLRSSEWALQKFESDLLIRTAQMKGIKISREPGWWDDDSEEYASGGMPQSEIEEIMSEWLTETGIFGAKKQFKEEKRKTFEWWYAKVVIPTLQVSVPIIALFLVYFANRVQQCK